ncbi:hypothetical protein [Bacillus piscicola]|uniref:ParM/StbA family protein n=1 Tax=Bacillus piscicola TaxID=1632684 RepID=UPI001F096643|nr:hypothetical protein [Bacillus piscicola]
MDNLEKVKELYEQDTLIAGVDQGNKSAKFSYLDEHGNIKSFAIPTVVAPANNKKSSLEGATNSSILENHLHLKISSDSIAALEERYVYVGHFARNKEGKEEPSYHVEVGKERSTAKTKFSNELHIITTLAGLAVMAGKTNKTTVRIPYAGGLPVSEMKELGPEKALESVKGTHVVKFIDGPMEGTEVTVIIEKGKMYGEGAITDLSLNFDIQNGVLTETSLEERLDDTYALGDLGAGTSDIIIFTEDGIDGTLSQSLNIEGTNPYIDRMIEAVNKLPEYEKLKRLIGLGEEEKAYQSREDFMNEVVEPGILAFINGNEERPLFEVRLMKKKKVDVTDIVMSELRLYADEHKAALSKAWNNSGVKDLVLVGGGVLFGYPVFKDVQQQFREAYGEDWVVFPDNIEDAPFFTSRGYLIANFMNTIINQTQPSA